jgi:tetratricopeptide (TPR) repeat protein
MSRARLAVLLCLGLSSAADAAGAGGRARPVRWQEPSPSPAAAALAPPPFVRGDAVVVVPPEVEPAGSEPAWVGELVSELLPRSLAMLGVAAVERDDRRRAQAALEIPLVPLTRATSIRVAEALGARRLVFGSYSVKDAVLTLRLQVLDLERARTAGPIVASGFLRNVGDVVHGVAWDLAGALGSTPVVTRERFATRRPAAGFEALTAFAQSMAAQRPLQQARLLRQALHAAPQFHEARLRLGRVQLDAGEFSAAHATLSRVPASSHLARNARFLQGVALLEIGRYHEAGELYANLAAERPTAAVLNNQGLAALRDSRRRQRASDLLRLALDRAPDSGDVAFNLGWALLVEGDPGAAEFYLRGLLRRDPLESHARVVLTWALLKAERAEDAAREWKGVLAMAPTYEPLSRPDPGRRFERILPSEALRPDERAERTSSEVAASLVGRADRRLAANDAEGALRDLTRAAYLDPYAPRVHLLLARAYRARGDRGRAESELRMTLWSQDDPAVRAELAALLKEMGRAEEAKVEAEKVLKMDPNNEVARKVISGG